VIAFRASWTRASSWRLLIRSPIRGRSVPEFNAFSSRYVNGNDNNLHQAGPFTDLNGITRTYLGSGTTAGFNVLNLSTQLALTKDLEFFARVANVFNAQYWTAGALAENPFNATG
jgi:iron complex outermembrane recepter protein